MSLSEHRYAATYCTPCGNVPGECIITPDIVRFVTSATPSPPGSGRPAGVDDYTGVALEELDGEPCEFQIEVRDVMECGAVAMPIEDPSNIDSGGPCTAFFLQVHVRTLDGRTFRAKAEAVDDPWRVLLRMQTRDALHEAVQLLLDGVEAKHRDPEPCEGASATFIPFACWDAEVEASIRNGLRAKLEEVSVPRRRHSAASSALARAWDVLVLGRGHGTSRSSASASSRGRSRRKQRAPGSGQASTPKPESPRSPPRLPMVAMKSDEVDVSQRLLTAPMAELIVEFLPVGLRMPGVVEWVLRYTPKAHGVSMSTLYRNLADRAKTVLVIKDAQARIFGGFAPELWEPKGKFYGSGEAFVFRFMGDGDAPELELFPWTSLNSFFMYSDFDLVAMGGGDGRHAFAVRSDLLHGFSSPTTTFGNPTLASSEEFVVRDIEVWALEEAES